MGIKIKNDFAVRSGPSACYTASKLLSFSTPISIDFIEKLPVPYGLVRYGVAPDHASVKNVVHKFKSTLTDPKCRFFGNVDAGSDVELIELKSIYGINSASSQPLTCSPYNINSILRTCFRRNRTCLRRF